MIRPEIRSTGHINNINNTGGTENEKIDCKLHLKAPGMFVGKAQAQTKSGAYTLVREHFGLGGNAAYGHTRGL